MIEILLKAALNLITNHTTYIAVCAMDRITPRDESW